MAKVYIFETYYKIFNFVSRLYSSLSLSRHRLDSSKILVNHFSKNPKFQFNLIRKLKVCPANTEVYYAFYINDPFFKNCLTFIQIAFNMPIGFELRNPTEISSGGKKEFIDPQTMYCIKIVSKRAQE